MSSIDHVVFQQLTKQTTLIVTPPSLASQWKEDFEKHALSLSILMFDGWSKVKVSITRRSRASITRRHSAKEPDTGNG